MQQNSILVCQASSMKCVGGSLYPQCEDLYFILSCKLFHGLCGCVFFFFFLIMKTLVVICLRCSICFAVFSLQVGCRLCMFLQLS